jgi:hypothetical protein
MRVFCASIATETNSFAPLRSDLADFQRSFYAARPAPGDTDRHNVAASNGGHYTQAWKPLLLSWSDSEVWREGEAGLAVGDQ